MDDNDRMSRALSNKNRRKIVAVLRQKEQRPSDLKKMIPLSDSGLSNELSKLRDLEIINERREGKNIFYTFNENKYNSLLEFYNDIFGIPLSNLKKFIASEEAKKK